MDTEERLSTNAPEALVVQVREMRGWVAELSAVIQVLTAVRSRLGDVLTAMPTDACQLCGRAYGSIEGREGHKAGEVKQSPDARFCQDCAAGAAYREWCSQRAEAHRAAIARVAPQAGDR